MSDADFALIEPAAPIKWTERIVLDALIDRFSKPGPYGRPPRYVVAEHVGLDPTFPTRILDFIAADTWASSGYALDGFEVKVSRSDLRRELADLTKSQAFEKHLDSFTIVAPAKVLTGWQAFELPGTWGVMSLADNGTLRYLRKPTSRATPSLSWNANNSTCPPLHRPLVAALLRGAVKTATRQRFEDTP